MMILTYSELLLITVTSFTLSIRFPFSVAGPVVLNSQLVAVREDDSLHSFRCKLKTCLFTLCFNDLLTVLCTFVMHSRTGAE